MGLCMWGIIFLIVVLFYGCILFDCSFQNEREKNNELKIKLTKLEEEIKAKERAKKAAYMRKYRVRKNERKDI